MSFSALVITAWSVPLLKTTMTLLDAVAFWPFWGRVEGASPGFWMPAGRTEAEKALASLSAAKEVYGMTRLGWMRGRGLDRCQVRLVMIYVGGKINLPRCSVCCRGELGWHEKERPFLDIDASVCMQRGGEGE